MTLLVAGMLAGTGCHQEPPPSERPRPRLNLQPRDMADSLHAVIAANREVYTQVIVQRLQDEMKIVPCSIQWQQDKALPIPAQLLRLTSEKVASKGAEFSYTLRALHPIRPQNRPETPVERQGLEFVAAHPGSNFYTNEVLGGRGYFTAVYPDRAVAPACVTCHNRHPNSPRKDYQLGDVMGGIVLRIALEL